MFPVSNHGLDGHVNYDREDDMAKEKVIGGDVDTFAIGTRNCFGMAYHSSGRLCVTDNGDNQAFGPRSTVCASDIRPPNEDENVLLLRQGA